MYADGVHAAYSQKLRPPPFPGQRGARVTGSLGTVEFDWYTDSSPAQAPSAAVRR